MNLETGPKHVGIHYNVDIANVFILVIVSSVAAVVFPYAKFSIDKEIPHEKHHYFYAMLLLCMTGLMGMAITGDAFNVFVFLEISSLSTYALIAMGKDPRCLTTCLSIFGPRYYWWNIHITRHWFPIYDDRNTKCGRDI